jgi:carbonic anhydrase
MNPALVPVAFAAVAVAAVGAGVYLSVTNEKKRRAALAQVALTLGLSYLDKVPEVTLSGLGNFHLLRHGHSKSGRSLMEGKSGDAQVTLLDYQYTTGGGKDSHTYRQTVAFYRGIATGLPAFTLAPEHFWHRIGALFGYQDINFEASEEFSRHYLLRGPDESAIRAVFGAEALGFFAQNLGWCLEAAGGSLAVYRAGKRCKPEEIQPFLAEAASVRRALVKD